jgi:hypothetical protein
MEHGLSLQNFELFEIENPRHRGSQLPPLAGFPHKAPAAFGG